jgi:hypothetical protein
MTEAPSVRPRSQFLLRWVAMSSARSEGMALARAEELAVAVPSVAVSLQFAGG